MRFLVFMFLLVSTTATATPHSVYFNGRGNDRLGVFISESAIGEFGTHTLSTEDTYRSSKWFGAGVNTEIGVEIEKFVQVSLNHMFLTTQNIDNAAENMRGFRLAPEFKAIFSSLAFNLEFGAGMSVSKFDYQNCNEITSVQGYGSFVSTGISYYFARHVASVLNVTKIAEKFEKINGDTDIHRINNNSYGISLGLRISF